MAVLGQPQVAEAAGEGGTGEVKVAAMVPQPLCIQPPKSRCARRHGIYRGQGDAKRRGGGMVVLGDNPPPHDTQSHISLPDHPYG